MGIVGDLPNPIISMIGVFMLSMLVLELGIVDFMMPENHVGSYILGFIGVATVCYYLLTCRDISEPIMFHVTESDGSKHSEFYMGQPTSFRTLLFGIGLSLISGITYLFTWTRLTSLMFIIFGTYMCACWIWMFYEAYIKREEKISG